MKLIGLTGGISCGKTTVCKILNQAYNISIIDCDIIAKQITLKESWGYRRVLKAFRGTTIVDHNGDIDREKLARIIFNDPNSRRKLNKATHLPVLCQIIAQILRRWLSFHSFVIIDMPLLFETGFYRFTNPNILISCNTSLQLQRLQERDRMQLVDAKARLAAQMSLEQKRQLADIVVANDGDLDELRERLDVLVQSGALFIQKYSTQWWFHEVAVSPLLICWIGVMYCCYALLPS